MSIQPEQMQALDPDVPIPFTLAPRSCPTWCVMGPAESDEHDGGPRAVVHRSAVAELRDVVQAELFQLDEEGLPTMAPVLYIEGAEPVQLDTVAEVDAFIADGVRFLAELAALRTQMGGAS